MSYPASISSIFSSILSLRVSISLAPLDVGRTVAALHAVSMYLSILVNAPLWARMERSICGLVLPSNSPLNVSEAVGSMFVCIDHYVGVIVGLLNSAESKPDAPCTDV